MMKFFNIVVLVTLLFPMSVYGESTSGTNIQEDQALKRSGELSPEERFTITQKKAESGDAEAQLNLGTMYANGNGVPKDIAKALKLYRKAAGQGHAIAQFNLGAVYLTGDGTHKDTAKALEWFRKAAVQEDPPAQYNLGWMYEHGEGVAKDAAKALEWYKKAADQGMEKAQYDLDRLNREVLTSKKLTPEQKAKEEFTALQKKAESGDIESQYNLGSIYSREKNTAKATEWYTKAAEQGNSQSQFMLGLTYLVDGKGRSKQIAKAIEWLQKSANQGYVNSQVLLGQIFYDGVDVPKDAAKALGWYEKAAAQGNTKALGRLGLMYLTGNGVTKNGAKAVELLEKGVRPMKGEDTIKPGLEEFLIGWTYMLGDGLPKNTLKAAEWYQKAAEKGHAEAQLYLGGLYFNGDGVSKDSVKGYAWLNLSAAQGCVEALPYRDSVEKILTVAERMEGQRLASNWKKGDNLLSSNSNYFDKYDEVPPNNKPNKQGSSTDQWAELDSYNIKESKLTKQATGTAFTVSSEGHALTNHHVINGCAEVKVVGQEGVAKVITSDSINDLALLQLSGKSKDVAKLNPGIDKLKQGEDVIVFGYPLSSVLSSGGNLTPGTLSALTGLGNNTNQIQITAPIQPGSSGSPVMDKKGNVVAVVSMKLDDGKMAKATGQIGQNVNFAVNGQTIKSFLELNKVPYKTGGGFFSMEKSNASIAEEAHKWTVLVECWK